MIQIGHKHTGGMFQSLAPLDAVGETDQGIAVCFEALSLRPGKSGLGRIFLKGRPA